MRLLTTLAALAASAAAEDVLRSTSLNTCQSNSQFTASLLNIQYTPNNQSAYAHIIGVSSIEGYAVFDITITAYGYDFYRRVVDPCDIGLQGLCPMVAAKMNPAPFNLPVSSSATSQIPGIAYTFPDLDAKVRVYVNMTTGDQAGTSVACLELNVSNGKTVDLVGVQWASALVILALLLASSVIGWLGHFNAAAHVMVHTLALFAYLQAQAMVGLCGMPLPPIVQAWTQDFQWTLGLVRINSMQSVLTWYQRATGGTPSQLFDSLSDVSVSVHKRALDVVPAAIRRGLVRRGLAPRSVVLNTSGSYVVYGIQRAAFKAGIEPTNAFLTSIGFVTALLVAAALAVVLLRLLCELAVRLHLLSGHGERTREFRHGWRTILKGVLFRCALAAYPAVAVFSLYEFTQDDSSAEMVNAAVYLVALTATLAFGAYTVIRLAARSIALHRNAAYILFSDAATLSKWGPFYVQFRASGYYFAAPLLAYAFVKSAFIGLSQRSGTVQAIALLLIEAAALITASVMRPWMDKSTNSFHIAICAVNLANAVILLIFSDVFDQPALGTGVVGVVFWLLNAAVTLILLLMLVVTTVVIFFRNNPDARYQFMADDRTSFVKSQSRLATNELDALAATARGESMVERPPRDRLLALDDGYGGGGAAGAGADTDSIVSDFKPPNLAHRSRMSRPSSVASRTASRNSNSHNNSSGLASTPSLLPMEEERERAHSSVSPPPPSSSVESRSAHSATPPQTDNVPLARHSPDSTRSQR